MFRQIGLAIGVAVLIAVLGAPGTPTATLNAYRNAWWVIVAISFISAIVALLLLQRRRTT
jgi:hypothetical protein